MFVCIKEAVSQFQAGWRSGIRALQVQKDRLLPKSPDRRPGDVIPIVGRVVDA